MRSAHIALVAPSRSGHQFVLRNIRSWGAPIMIHTFENTHPEQLDGTCEDASGRRYPIALYLLQTRGYLNWLASLVMHTTRYHYRPTWEAKIDRAIDAWMAIAAEAHGRTQHLGGRYLQVEYECFRDDAAYRRRLCSNLYGEYNESELLRVPDVGDGSSFNGTEFSGRANLMTTDNRWREIQDYPVSENAFVEAVRRRPDGWTMAFELMPPSDEQREFVASVIA